MSPEVRKIIPPSSKESEQCLSSEESDPQEPLAQTQEILLNQIAFLVSTAQSVPPDWKGTYLAAIIKLSKAALAIDSLDIPKISQQRERHQLQPSTLPQNPPLPPVPSLQETPPGPTAVANQTPTAPEPTAEKEATAAPDSLATVKETAEEYQIDLRSLRRKVREAKEGGKIKKYGAARSSAYPREELATLAQKIKERVKRAEIQAEIPLAIPDEPLVSLKEVANNPDYPVNLDQLRYCVKGAVKGGFIIRTGEKRNARYPESQIRAIARQLPRITTATPIKEEKRT